MVLGHYADSKRVLRYEPQTGVFEEMPADGSPTAFGFFTDSQCGLWGVYASPTGPVLFHGSRRFELTAPGTAIDLEQGVNENRFRLLQADVLRAECTYKRPSASDWGYDNWSAEEDSADFFLWLSHQLGTKDFVERYTRPQEAGGGQAMHRSGES